MHSSDTNVSSYYDTNSTGNNNIFQNKQHFLSFINATSFNPNKYKILNIINKKESVDLNNINRKQTNSILNKILNNQSKREKVLSNKAIQDISFNSDKLINNNVDNIFLNQLANQSKNNPIFNKAYNPNTNNIITNNYQTNINEKTQKINYALESHQLINSLLKNQNKNSKKNNNKNKVVNNPSEISFSSSFDNNTKKMFDISPSKDSYELSSNNNNQNDSFSKNLYSQYCNQNKENKETVQINNNINNINTINNISYDNNIFLGLNKENNDKQNQNNQHFNSPHYNFYNNNTNKINNNYRNKHQFSNSPLRMADVFMLKKHHSIKPYNKVEKNNCLESITFSNKNVKKIIFIKPSNSKSKDDEEKNEDEIKVIRQKDKNGKKEIKNEKEINNIKIATEISENKKLSGIKFFKDIINEKKENKEKSEIKINDKNNENKELKDNNNGNKEIIKKDKNEIKDNKNEIKEKKDNKENKDNKVNKNIIKIKDNKENKEFQRNNDIFKIPKKKYIKNESNNENKINTENNNIYNINNIDLRKRIHSPINITNENEVNKINKDNIKVSNNHDNNNETNKNENERLSIKIDKISNNNDGIKIRNTSPKKNFNINNYLNKNKNEDERPQNNSIRRRFMNSKNKYNYTPDIETRNKNNQLVKQNKINTYMEKSSYNNININVEKYKGIKSFENIKKEEPFKINLSTINNKENEEIKKYDANVNINTEKEKLINNNILNIQKEIRKTYYSPNKEKINLSPIKNKKSQFQSAKKVKNNSNIIFSDDEKLREKEKEKIVIKDNDKEKDRDQEKKIEEEDENIKYRRRFQSESEKEKRMRRARRFLKENKDKDKDKDRSNIIKNGKENERNEDNKKNDEVIKNNDKNRKTNKINERTLSNKDKNINCFSMQNLFGVKNQNKNQLKKENKNKNGINLDDKKNENKNNCYEGKININDNSDINNKKSQNSEILKYKKGYKMNKEEEIRKNEEETQKIKDNNIEEMWKRRRRDMIPKNLKSNNLSSKLNEINNKNILKTSINKEENINDDNIKKSISIKSPKAKNKKKITILEDVQIEEINTTKPVVQINISQILLSINNDLNVNQNKKNKNLYIYGFDKKNNNFIQFDLRKKKFLRTKISDIEDLSDTFEKDYTYQNTILYNTLTGVFILTGKNSDQLYYYNPINETIMKICQFKNSHNLGCLLLDEENNKIIIIGGKNATICESYAFDTNELKEMPNLNVDRSNTSFIISNNKIFGFFGYSYKKGKYLYNIEYINKNTLDKWEIIELNVEFKKDLLPFHLKNISTFIYDHDPNKIMIYGGKQGRSELIVDNYYYIYNIEENNFEKIEGLCYNIIKDFKGINIWKKSETIENEDKKGFFFDKEKQFIELPEEDRLERNNENICVIIDSECNIHFLTKNKKKINVYKFNK